MKRNAGLLAAAMAGLLAASAAQAQATRTFVSGVGDDANPCSRTAPCLTFQGALAKTAAGGEIDCLDPGDFGGMSIEKSISVICDRIGGLISNPTFTAIVISSPTAHVVLSGLTIDGVQQPGVWRYSGINIIAAASVLIRNSTISNFRYDWGVRFNPYNAAKLVLDNVVLANNGNATDQEGTTGGLLVTPSYGPGSNSGAPDVKIYRSQIRGIANGIRIHVPSGTPVSTMITARIEGTTVSGSASSGIVVDHVGGTVKADVVRSVIMDNEYGITLVSQNPGNATVRVGKTAFNRNPFAVFPLNPTVRLLTYGDNMIDLGTALFTGTVPKR